MVSRRGCTVRVVASTQINIRVEDLPAFRELYEATHAMLVARLVHGQKSVEFLQAINRVIAAHDEIADGQPERP